MAIEMRVLWPDIAKNVFQVHSSQFTSLPCFYLLSHRLKVALHSVDPDGDAVDERERLRVFREHGSKHA